MNDISMIVRIATHAVGLSLQVPFRRLCKLALMLGCLCFATVTRADLDSSCGSPVRMLYKNTAAWQQKAGFLEFTAPSHPRKKYLTLLIGEAALTTTNSGAFSLDPQCDWCGYFPADSSALKAAWSGTFDMTAVTDITADDDFTTIRFNKGNVVDYSVTYTGGMHTDTHTMSVGKNVRGWMDIANRGGFNSTPSGTFLFTPDPLTSPSVTYLSNTNWCTDYALPWPGYTDVTQLTNAINPNGITNRLQIQLANWPSYTDCKQNYDLTNEYTTPMLEGAVRANLIRCTPAGWGNGVYWNCTSCDSFDAVPYAAHRFYTNAANDTECLSLTNLIYSFNITHTEADVVYELKWKEVTIYDDGTSPKIVKRSIAFTGNGSNYVTSEFICPPPLANGSSTVSAPEIKTVDGCASCGGPPGGPPPFAGGDFSPGVSSVDVSMSMGLASQGQSAGRLYLKEQWPGLFGTPSYLRYDTMRSDVDVITNSSGLYQIKTPFALLHVDVLTSTNYMLKFYLNSASTRTKTGGYYGTNASPYATYKFENPDGVSNHLVLVETWFGASRTWTYDWIDATQGWKLTRPNSLGEEQTYSYWDANSNDRYETNVVRNPSGTEVSRVTRKYHAYPWGEAIVQERVDPASAPLVTTWNYDSAGYANGSSLPLTSVLYPNGHWEYYGYDSSGRTIAATNPKTSVL